MKAYVRIVSVLLLGLVLPLSGCGSSSSPSGTSSSTSTSTASTVASSGVLRVGNEGVQDLSTVDLDPPAENLGANSIFVMSLLYGGLVRLDEKLHIAPDGATGWTVSNGGRTYTFHIRPGLKFSDGTRVSASDFVYSLNRAFSPKFANVGNTQYFLSHIVGSQEVTKGKAKSLAGVKAMDSSTVQITTDAPTAAFLDQLSNVVSAVVPRAVIAKYGNKGWTAHEVGTGPFFVKRWLHGKEIDLAPNPYYWRGKPKLGTMRILFVQNPDTAYNLYQHGDLDVMGAVQFPSDKLTSARSRSDFKQVPQLFTEYLPPNEKKRPFNNVHVRRAFSFAINREALVSRFLNGQYVPAHGILPPGIPGYDPSLKGQTFDPKAAQAELAKAGYPNGKGFPQTALSFSGGDPGQKSSAQVLQRFWSKYLNVNVALNQMEQGAYNNALNARNFQLAFISWGEDYPDPQNFLSLQLQTGSSNNNGGYSNAAFDTLTKAADTQVGDNVRRFGQYRQAERIALRDAAWVVLYWGKSNILINSKVHGLVINGGGLTAANWANVTVK
ncbi:MAG: ABC transporter substrate-binding protein [Chloroflexota bacterium]